jgi:hypothetical protein
MVLLLCFAVPVMAASTKELRSAVAAKFAFTTRNAMAQVVKPGTTLVLQQPGLRSDKRKVFIRPAVIRAGQLEKVGEGGFLEGTSGKALEPDAKLRLYNVKVSKDYIVLLVATTDACEMTERGNSRLIPYKAAASFAYDGGSASLEPTQLLTDIDAWFKTEVESAAASTQSIALGQTLAEVIIAFGAPQKKDRPRQESDAHLPRHQGVVRGKVAVMQ